MPSPSAPSDFERPCRGQSSEAASVALTVSVEDVVNSEPETARAASARSEASTKVSTQSTFGTNGTGDQRANEIGRGSGGKPTSSRARSHTFSAASQRLSLVLERLRSRREPYAWKWASDLPAHPSHKPLFAGRFNASTAKRLRVIAVGTRISARPPHRSEHAQFTGEWREGISLSRSLRTVRETLASYGSHHPVVVRNSAQCAKR